MARELSHRLSADEYLELIDHLDGYSHQIFHGDEAQMDEAIRIAKCVPELLSACQYMLRAGDISGHQREMLQAAIAKATETGAPQ